MSGNAHVGGGGGKERGDMISPFLTFSIGGWYPADKKSPLSFFKKKKEDKGDEKSGFFFSGGKWFLGC